MREPPRAPPAPTLRRLDWRFVLPAPADGAPFAHLALLGAADGLEALARLAVEAGVASRASAGLPGAGLPTAPVDAVAALEGADPLAAADRLAPGGVLWWEVRRRSPADLLTHSPERLAARLATAGLRLAGLYAVLPGFGASKAFLPLDVRGALRWYVDHLLPSPTAARRLVEGALRAGLGLDARRLARVAPHLGVVAVRGDERPASALGHADLPAALRAPGVRPLVFADAGNRVALLPFAADGVHPLAVLKVPKRASVNDRTEHEQAALHTIRAGLPAPLAAAIPAPLGIHRWGAVSVAHENWLPGRALLRSSGGWGTSDAERVADLRGAAAWLAEFHAAAVLERGTWDDAAVARWVEEPAARYEARFGVTAEEAGLFARLRERAREARGVPFALVWQHRDYNVWNVVRDGARVGVIDWEGARPGPPLCDLLHFAVHWHEAGRHLRDETSQRAGLRALFLEPPAHRNPLARAAHEALAAYMTRVGLDARLLPVLLCYTWVELALRRADQQTDMGERPADPRAGNRNFAFIDVLAAGADRLFAGGGA